MREPALKITTDENGETPGQTVDEIYESLRKKGLLNGHEGKNVLIHSKTGLYEIGYGIEMVNGLIARVRQQLGDLNIPNDAITKHIHWKNIGKDGRSVPTQLLTPFILDRDMRIQTSLERLVAFVPMETCKTLIKQAIRRKFGESDDELLFSEESIRVIGRWLSNGFGKAELTADEISEKLNQLRSEKRGEMWKDDRFIEEEATTAAWIIVRWWLHQVTEVKKADRPFLNEKLSREGVHPRPGENFSTTLGLDTEGVQEILRGFLAELKKVVDASHEGVQLVPGYKMRKTEEGYLVE